MTRCAKTCVVVLLIFFSSGTFVIQLYNFWEELTDSAPDEVENWLKQNQLGQYKQLFKDKGKCIFHAEFLSTNLFHCLSL